MISNLNNNPLHGQPSILDIATPTVSQKFIKLLGNNYKNAVRREKIFGFKSMIEPENRLKYRNLINPDLEGHTNRFMTNCNIKAIKRNPRVRFVNPGLQNRNTSLIALKLTNKMQAKQPRQCFNVSLKKRKKAMKTQSLFFLANNEKLEAFSQDKIFNCLKSHSTRKKTSKMQNYIQIQKSSMLKPKVKKKQKIVPIGKHELADNKKVISFCDYQHYRFRNKRSHTQVLTPMNLPYIDVKENLITNISNDNTLMDYLDKHRDRPHLNIKSMNFISKNQRIKRRRKLNNKEKDFIAEEGYNRRKMNGMIMALRKGAINNLLNAEEKRKKSMGRKYSQLNKKTLQRKKFMKKYNMRLNQSLDKELAKDCNNFKDDANKTTWMKIIERLLDTNPISSNNLIGYYNHYRLFNKKNEHKDEHIIKNIVERLKMDMEDELKFDFNFRNYDDYLV